MKIGKKVVNHLVLCGVLLACSRGVLALECHLNGTSGPTREIEDIGALTVPANLPVGSRLWTSKIMTRNVTCWSEDSALDGEWVYFYGNPAGHVVRPGIGMGLIYNDADLGIVGRGSKVRTDMWRNESPKRGQVRFQIYLEKTGNIKEGGNDRVAVFQLDGVGGINAFEGKNYRYVLQGMSGIKVSSCSVTIDVPREIDFGVVSSDGSGIDRHQTLECDGG